MKKPKAKITGKDGNVFNLVGICVNALKKANLNEQAKEMQSKVFKSHSYEDAIDVMGEYCELV